MDAAFLVVIAIALLFLSAMIVARMAASGAPARRIAVPVLELWLALVIWILVFKSVSGAIGTPISGGEAGELRDLASRLSALHSAARLWALLGIVASVALVAHLTRSFRRTIG